MKPDMMDGMSMNLEQTNMDKLRAVFPECFVEGRLDIDKLLSLCGEYIINDFEKYKQGGVSEAGAKALHGHTAPLPGGERQLGYDAESLYRGR